MQHKKACNGRSYELRSEWSHAYIQITQFFSFVCKIIAKIITFAKKVMFYLEFVCLFVCVFVSNLT